MPKLSDEPLCYAVWPTAWGAMGAVAGPAGLCRVELPHYQPDDLEELLRWNHPGAERSEAPFAALIELTRGYFNGRPVDFSPVACELPGPATFKGKVLRACRTIPHGRTRSYVSLADQIGSPDSARAVAGALARNPLPLVVPCHRVIYADGRLGGFSAPGGVELKQRMLRLEGER